MAVSPSTGLHCRLRNLRPNFDVVFESLLTPCLFSVHRMALVGKELGKDVGQWFRPSTTAGAIRCVDAVRRCRVYADGSFRSLVQSFPDALLGISVAVDGQIFQTDVYLASHRPPNLLVPANYLEGVRSSYSSVSARNRQGQPDI